MLYLLACFAGGYLYGWLTMPRAARKRVAPTAKVPKKFKAQAKRLPAIDELH